MARKNAEKKRNSPGRWFSALLGFLCALVLIVIFYGAMVYQLGDDAQHAAPAAGSPARLALGGAKLMDEAEQHLEIDRAACSVFIRTYVLPEGGQAQAVSASPAAYMSRLSEEKWESQLVTGFSLAGMDAVYMTRGSEGLLAARDGDSVYLLLSAADEAKMYELGASAYLE